MQCLNPSREISVEVRLGQHKHALYRLLRTPPNQISQTNVSHHRKVEMNIYGCSDDATPTAENKFPQSIFRNQFSAINFPQSIFRSIFRNQCKIPSCTLSQGILGKMSPATVGKSFPLVERLTAFETPTPLPVGECAARFSQ